MSNAITADTGRATRWLPELDRPIYTLSVASEVLETHPRTLMMYETVGLVVPSRTATNRRRYSQRDLNKLRSIQFLTRRHGVNLAGVRFLFDLLGTLRKHGIDPPPPLDEIETEPPEAAASA